LHLVGSSRISDVKWLVVMLGFDGQSLLIEPPFLCVSSVWCLDIQVSGL
jgi:hypothetical protein